MTTLIAFLVGVGIAPLVSEVPVVKQLHNAMFGVAEMVRTWITGKPE